ncbi:MAG: coproporphyrinogen III oxidase family protein [bacterium]|nr:coproporphyrinogen III oxidase family protein [bacterium]
MDVKLDREHFINQYPPFNVMSVKENESLFANKPVHLYAHIPFCPQKCGYCYYKSFDDISNNAIEEYLENLKKEILMYSKRPEVKNKIVKSLYFGGGTPTILSCQQYESLVKVIFDNFRFEEGFEFCSEARPDETTLDREKLELLKKLGVNRISFGSQNLSKKILDLNRRATSVEYLNEVFKISKELKFKIINLDIMSGMYGETDENWEYNITKLMEMKPESIVFYKMELFLNTQLYKDLKKQNKTNELMTNQKEIQHIQYAFKRLREEGGYIPGNCFNLVRGPEFYHKHRREIWLGDDMKAFGVTAHSCCDGFLYQNTFNLKEYNKMVAEGALPIKRTHRLTPREDIAQAMVYGVKSLYVNREQFRKRFGYDMTELYGETIDQLLDKGYLTIDDEALRVPPEYYAFADDICRAFFVPDQKTMMVAHMSRK